MSPEQLQRLLQELIALPHETEWVEFKVNYAEPKEIGEYVSALANAACLHDKPQGYLVYGVENRTHKVVGTKFRPRQAKVGNQGLEMWLTQLLDPKPDFAIREFAFEGRDVVLFAVDAAGNRPVRFSGMAHVRVGDSLTALKNHPEKERKIWLKTGRKDWSAGICAGATLADLDPAAIQKGRVEYKNKNPDKAGDVDGWTDTVFLNKAKVTIHGKITRTAIILLGKPEAEHYLSPAVAQITWVLKDEHNVEKDYRHFGPPLLLNVEKAAAGIRNLNYRYLPNNTLFPVEVTQYDPWVLREALHNSVAHQDYELGGRINLVERPDELVFANLGHFIPGSVERVIEQDAPQEFYRNPFLAHAMVNLNMIDTIGGGIKKMFLKQRKRFFPLPDYDLSQEDRVQVRIQGKILDENYTRLLIENADLPLETVMLLDRVQKRRRISKEDHQRLKRQQLVEGRYPNLIVSSKVAAVTGKRAEYIRYRGFDDGHYQQMILEYLGKFGSATRKDINTLLLGKLPDILSAKQKMTKINRLLSVRLKAKLGLIRNEGSDAAPKWVLTDKGREAVQ